MLILCNISDNKYLFVLNCIKLHKVFLVNIIIPIVLIFLNETKIKKEFHEVNVLFLVSFLLI